MKEVNEGNLVKRQQIGAETSAFAFIALDGARDVVDDHPSGEKQVSVPCRVNFEKAGSVGCGFTSGETDIGGEIVA